MRTSTQRSRVTGSVGEQAEELQLLRLRAYGPDADIAGDAEAQARLSELEAAQRRQLTPFAEAAASDPAPVTVPDLAGRPVVDSESAAAQPAPWSRRRRWAILGGAIAALALNVAVVAWLSQLLTEDSAAIPAETSTATMPRLHAGHVFGYYVPSPDYVLAVRSVGFQADAPNDQHGTLELLGISPDELRRYESFQGLNVWSAESRYGLTCLLVAVPVQGLREGLSTEGCSLGGLDAHADLPPTGGDGLIRFVLRGDHVNVYVYESGADPNASQG